MKEESLTNIDLLILPIFLNHSNYHLSFPKQFLPNEEALTHEGPFISPPISGQASYHLARVP